MQGLSFPTIFGYACSGQAIPVTLQDDAYTHCSVAGAFRESNSLAGMLTTVIPLTMGACFFVWLSTRFLPSLAMHPATPWVVTLVMAVIILAVTRRNARRKGTAAVGHADVTLELKTLLADLCTQKRRVPGLTGLVVLKVSDDSWQTAVVTVMERSAAVVIDVTDLSDNLAWELSTTLEMHPPERIVVSARVPAGTSNRECERRVRASIQQIVSCELAERFRIFFYPKCVGSKPSVSSADRPHPRASSIDSR